MNGNELDVYLNLQKHLDKMPIGYPSTKSGIELKVLKHLFSPEEAKIAVHLTFIPTSLRKIYRRMKNLEMSVEELELKLDNMYKKGSIIYKKEANEKYYANAQLIIGMYEFQLGRLTKEFSQDARKYLEEAFIEQAYNKAGIPQMRTIPIEYSISHEQSIATYDDIRTLIKKNEGFIGVMECICRKGNDLLGKPCKQTHLRETCFSFMQAANAFHERGYARLISKEEAFEIIKKAEEDGLILQPTNSQNPIGMCCCCGCCCDIIKNQKRFNNPSRLFATNFYADTNIDLCNGCGMCIEICQMNAIDVIKDVSITDKNRCIGCGNCVPKCPENARILVRKEIKTIPAETTQQTYQLILNKKLEQEKQINRI